MIHVKVVDGHFCTVYPMVESQEREITARARNLDHTATPAHPLYDDSLYEYILAKLDNEVYT